MILNFTTPSRPEFANKHSRDGCEQATQGVTTGTSMVICKGKRNLVLELIYCFPRRIEIITPFHPPDRPTRWELTMHLALSPRGSWLKHHDQHFTDTSATALSETPYPANPSLATNGALYRLLRNSLQPFSRNLRLLLHDGPYTRRLQEATSVISHDTQHRLLEELGHRKRVNSVA